MDSKIHFEDTWGLFIGTLHKNLPHQHFAVQLSISPYENLHIKNGSEDTIESHSSIIKSNTRHQLTCEAPHLNLLMYPSSSLGHCLNKYAKEDIFEFNHPIVGELEQHTKDYIEGIISFNDMLDGFRKSFKKLSCECEGQNHFDDERIEKAVGYLEQNFGRIVPVEEIADYCCLSSDRFLHLFKEKTGITYRQVQQWNKLSQSFASFRVQSITETAHQYGFADSAHYSKIFKQTFGFSPKQILSN